jgi:hypothetical protein
LSLFDPLTGEILRRVALYRVSEESLRYAARTIIVRRRRHQAELKQRLTISFDQQAGGGSA